MNLIPKLLLLALLLGSCSKNLESKNFNYKSIDNFSKSIEIGIDDDNNAYIADLERNIQIILVCHIKNGYRNQDFKGQIYDEIHIFHPDWNEKQMENYGKSRIDYCIPEAFKIKEDYDSHFKKELKKYYVFYKELNVYRLFNK